MASPAELMNHERVPTCEQSSMGAVRTQSVSVHSEHKYLRSMASAARDTKRQFHDTYAIRACFDHTDFPARHHRLWSPSTRPRVPRAHMSAGQAPVA